MVFELLSTPFLTINLFEVAIFPILWF
jgi:hypothetical protein